MLTSDELFTPPDKRGSVLRTHSSVCTLTQRKVLLGEEACGLHHVAAPSAVFALQASQVAWAELLLPTKIQIARVRLTHTYQGIA